MRTIAPIMVSCRLMRRFFVEQRFVIVALLVAFLAGCWGNARGIDPPDFTERNLGVEESIDQVVGRSGALFSDMDAFFAARDAFFSFDETFWDGVPKDLFKHAAMACLNEPVGADAQPGTDEWEAAKAMQVGCVVLPLGPLRAQTSAGAWPSVVDRMRDIDRLRRLRSRLKREFRRVPEYVVSVKGYVAERRSDVRKVEAEVKRKKPEYGDENYAIAMERAKAYRARLSELERAVEELDRAVPGNSATLETEIESLYRRLATL